MKNLCFLCFCIEDFGGVNRVVSAICNELSMENNVHLVSICGDKSCKYELNANISVYNIKADPSWRLRNIAKFSFKKIINYLNSNNIQTAFLIGHYVPAIALLSKPFVKCKFIFCDHGALENQINDKKATLFRKIAYIFSNKTIVLTKRSVNAYKKYFKAKDKKIDYIYNFVDDSLFEYADEYNSDSQKIITVGRFTPEKGYDMLVDIAKEVLNKNPDWEWHLYGDGECLDQIRSKIAEYGLDNRLVLKGSGYNIYDIYKKYSLYVLTSYREGLPLTLLEAKANNLPIVSFDCITGPSEIVRNGIDGYLIECYNKEKMADKISKIIQDKNLRLKLSSKSRENLYIFNKSVIMEKWKNLIKEI